MENLADKLSDYLPGEDESLDVSEHVNVLFDGQDLSEEFKNKATTIFEAAVRSEALSVAAAILEAATDHIIENDIAMTEMLDEEVENSFRAIVEAWGEANVVPLQARLKTEITEDFMHGMLKLFNDHNIMLPEEEIAVVEAMADKNIELEAELNEQVRVNIELRKQLNEAFRELVIDELSEGLNEVETTKFRSLCEAIDASEDFEVKAEQLKESYFGTNAKAKLGKGTSGEEHILTESEVNAEAKMIREEANKPAAGTNAPAVLTRFAPRR